MYLWLLVGWSFNTFRIVCIRAITFSIHFFIFFFIMINDSLILIFRQSDHTFSLFCIQFTFIWFWIFITYIKTKFMNFSIFFLLFILFVSFCIWIGFYLIKLVYKCLIIFIFIQFLGKFIRLIVRLLRLIINLQILFVFFIVLRIFFLFWGIFWYRFTLLWSFG